MTARPEPDLEAADRWSDDLLPLSKSLAVFGVPVRFRTTSPDVVAAIHDSFGWWSGSLASDPTGGHDVAIAVETPMSTARAVTYDATPDRLDVRGPDGVGFADRRRRCARGVVTASAVADRSRFRQTWVEALTLFLLTGPSRHPLHAALVGRDGTGLLFLGSSGSGKSTLAYAMSQRGWVAYGEDIAYVDTDPDLRVWANPGLLHLMPDVCPFFPEVSRAPLVTRADGKRKHAVVARPAGGAMPFRDVRCCVLSGSMGAARCEPAPAGAIRRALTTELAPGFDRDPASAERVADALEARGGWRVWTSADPLEGAALVDASASG